MAREGNTSSAWSAVAACAGVALITGCSDGGIGHSLAMELAQRGYQVVATSRSVSSMGPSVQDHPNVQVMALDVTSVDSISQAVASIMQKHARIDLLINNAGTPCNAPTAEVPLSLLESTFRTNVFGPIALIQAVVPHMAKAKRGKIVNIGSIGGLVTGAWTGAYAASKSALHVLTDSLRLELKPFGLHVILVIPGGVVSNFAQRAVSVLQDLDYNLYAPYKQAIVTRAKYSQSPYAVPTSLFAKKTIDAVLSKSPPRCFIYGHLSKTYSFLYYMPLWVRDWYFLKRAGLSQLLN